MTTVRELMAKQVHTCSPDQPLSEAAKIMWDRDVGSAPVVDTDGRLLGMITDRDICMHAYTSGRALSEELVSSAMSREAVSVSPDDPLEDAERAMVEHQLRRLPVTVGGRLAGILSMADLARAARERPRSEEPAKVAEVLARISAPRTARA